MLTRCCDVWYHTFVSPVLLKCGRHMPRVLTCIEQCSNLYQGLTPTPTPHLCTRAPWSSNLQPED